MKSHFGLNKDRHSILRGWQVSSYRFNRESNPLRDFYDCIRNLMPRDGNPFSRSSLPDPSPSEGVVKSHTATSPFLSRSLSRCASFIHLSSVPAPTVSDWSQALLRSGDSAVAPPPSFVRAPGTKSHGWIDVWIG